MSAVHQIITETAAKEKKIKRFISCFEKISETNKFLCLVEDCGESVSSEAVAIRHLEKKHAKIKNIIRENKSQKSSESNDSKIEIKVKITEHDILNALVDLIAFNAVPFSICDSSGMKKLLQPYIDGLKANGTDLRINRRNIKQPLSDTAIKIKAEITSKLDKKMVCLMLDIASRYNRAVLGITVCAWIDDKIEHFTLAMHTLTKSHTSKNLFDVVINILKEFNIDLSQILSVTTDNARDVKKLAKLLDEAEEARQHVNETLIYLDNDGSDDDEEDGAEQNDESDMDPTIFDERYFNDLLANIANQFVQAPYTNLISGVSCAAHILHLVVIKSLQCSSTVNLLERCRSLVKKLRTPTFTQWIKESNKQSTPEDRLNMAIIDVKTRWSSTYFMVS